MGTHRSALRRPLVVSLAVAALVSACGGPDPDETPSERPTTAEPSASSPAATPTTPTTSSGRARAGEPRELVDGLEVPWGITFLPDGSALVGERDRHRILHVTAAGKVTHVGTIDGVAEDTSEGGLMGLATSPEFATDRQVFAYLTAADDNRIIRFRYEDGRVRERRTVFTGIPKAGNHDGGRIAFGPDDFLYVTTGDAGQAERAQDRRFLGGKILRMTPEGEPAPGNPFGDSVVYTYGHRNPQGLAWGPGDRLYQAEFGQNALDEVNLLRPGRNYGWPDVEGTNGPRSPRFERPLNTWPTGDASPSGLAYAGGYLWLATLQGENVYRMTVAADGSVGKPRAMFDDRWGRLRTVIPAPDGSLWVTTSNKDGRGGFFTKSDRIIRIPLT